MSPDHETRLHDETAGAARSTATPPDPPGPSPSAQPLRADAILPSDPPKEPVAALLFTLFFVCAGYFVIGQWQKGITAIAVFLVEVVFALGVGVVTAGCGACVVIPLTLGIHAAFAADCYLQAQQLKAGHPIGQWTFFNGHL